MAQSDNRTDPPPSVEEIQQHWHELGLRVARLEAERSALEQENKALRSLLERAIEHRQKSHGELVLLLTSLVSKLPINDVGVLVARLVEHNTHVSETCAVLAKGKVEVTLPQPAILKALDQTKRDLAAALKLAVEELIQLDTPLEPDLLRSLIAQPDVFLSPAVVRAARSFVKGQVPRERIVRQFGDPALVFFNDLTTDPKLNPRPKAEEIMLGFKNEFETLIRQNAALGPDKRQALQALQERVQRSKAPTESARSQRSAFSRLSFILELLHYYNHQSTEAPDVVFAQRLPALIEQLVLTSAQDHLEDKWIVQAEALLAFVASPDHRLMIVNNVGKGGGSAHTLKYVLRLRVEGTPDQSQVIAEFVRHLLPPPPQKPPQPRAVAAVLRLVPPAGQRPVVKAILHSDRLPKDQAETLGKALGKELGLSGLEEEAKAPAPLPVETERQMAWDRIKDLLNRRAEPGVIAAAVRDRLHAKYDADEIKQSWLTLIEADVMTLIRVFCQLPYLADGTTDPIARTVMESYVNRLMHEKYAAAYHKVVNSLRNIFKAKPDSPTLLNFIALVGWVDSAAADKLSLDIGMPAPAH